MKTRVLFTTVALCAAALLLAGATAQANIITFTGTAGGEAQNVTFNFTFGANSASVAINNNIVGPTDVGQNLSGLNFSLVGGLTGTLTSVSGQLSNIAADGTFANTSGTPDWFQSGPGFLTTSLGASGPDNTLIGSVCQPSGTYSCSDGSIDDNGPHNPFTRSTLTLSYSVLGANSATQLASLTGYFGTGSAGADIPVGHVPEPATMLLFGIALVAGGYKMRRRFNLASR